MSSDSGMPSAGRAEDIRRGVRRLPPAAATLFEMRFARGMSAEQIARALTRDPAVTTAFVEQMLRDAFDDLAFEVGAYDDAERAELALALTSTNGRGRTNGGTRPGVAEEPPQEALAPRPERPKRRRLSRRMRVAALATGLLAAVGAAALAFTGGDDTAENQGTLWRPVPKPAPPKRETAPRRPAARRPAVNPGRVTFRRVEGAASGRAVARRVEDGRVRIAVGGLPRPGAASYSLWAYDGRRRALLLGESERGSFTLAGRLPRGAAGFRFLDISRQGPQLARTRHSGASVLRARLAPLLRRGG